MARAASSTRRPPEILTEAECQALIDSCSRRAPTGIRNAALIAVLWKCGLRIAEALALRPADVDLDARSLRVLHGKGDRPRTVGVPGSAAALLDRWLDARAALQMNGRRQLFCTLGGGPLSDAYVRALLPRLARRAGIDKRVHAHGLRHTFTAELAREGKPIHVIRDALGHSTLATTDRYLRDVAPVEVIEAMAERD